MCSPLEKIPVLRHAAAGCGMLWHAAACFKLHMWVLACPIFLQNSFAVLGSHDSHVRCEPQTSAVSFRFEQSQQDAFFKPTQDRTGRESTPSDVSSVVSSTEKLRERDTPERRHGTDMNIDVPVDELDLWKSAPDAGVDLLGVEDAVLPGEALDMEKTPSKTGDEPPEISMEMEQVPDLGEAVAGVHGRKLFRGVGGSSHCPDLN